MTTETKTKTRMLFLNIPVTDLARTRAFFTELGFVFNEHFCDDTALCMRVGADAFVMLLTRERFAGFTKRPVADIEAATAGLFAVTAESRAEVDRLADRALELGARPAMEPQDMGFMYTRTFLDLDGHHWELFWMDPAAVPPEA